jgi:hypothetical protein
LIPATAKMLYGEHAMAEFDVEDYRSVPDAKRSE